MLREIAFGVLDDGDVPVHQAKVTIPPADHEKALTELVRAGVVMHNRISRHRETRDFLEIAEALAALEPTDGPLRVDVWAPEHIVPWHLLAFPDPDSEVSADPSRIFGYRHRICYAPPRPRPPHEPPHSRRPAPRGPRTQQGLGRMARRTAGARREPAQRLAATSARGAGALTVAVPADDDVLDVLLAACRSPSSSTFSVMPLRGPRRRAPYPDDRVPGAGATGVGSTSTS